MYIVATLHLKSKLIKMMTSQENKAILSAGLWTQSSERYGRDTMEVLSVIESAQVSM